MNIKREGYLDLAKRNILTQMLEENVQVHNLGEERNVGLVNYELSIIGKNNLDSVSRKIILKQAEDLVQDT